MRIVVFQQDAMIADVVSDQEAVFVGADPACRVILDDGQIAPKHAVIFPEADDSWSVEPLVAAPALTLNGQPLAAKQPLKPEDELRLNDFLIRVFPEYREKPGQRVALGVSLAQLERFAKSTLPPGTVLRKLDEPLTLQPAQLAPVARAAVNLAGCTTIEELMSAALQSLLESFAAQRAWLGVRRATTGRLEYVEGRLLNGQSTELPELGESLKPRVLDRVQFALVPGISRDNPCSVLAGPLLSIDGALGLAYVDTGDSQRRFEQRDLDAFVMQCHAIAAQLDTIVKGHARLRQAIVQAHAGLAHEAQVRLTPRKLPQWEQFQFGACRVPGRLRSGDVYDVLRLANNLAAFLIARTTAEGALPALLMAQAQTAFRVAVMHQDTPAVFMRTLNWMLFDGQTDHPLNCLAGVIDPPTGQLRYALAGEMGAYIINRRGEPRSLAPRDPAPPIGAAKSTVYPLLPEQLGTGETLTLFTTGVATTTDRNAKAFGAERTINLLCDGFGQPVSALLRDVVEELQAFTADGQQPEDITLLVAQRL